MPVRNVNLNSIDGRRFSKREEKMGSVRVDHNSTVTLVQEVDPDTAGIEFRYTASYGGVGVIRMEGTIAFQGDATSLTEQWSSTNQMPTEIASEIHTAVMRVCVPEAVGIAKNLQLPPPIPLPQVKFQNKDGDEGSGSPPAGPEVA